MDESNELSIKTGFKYNSVPFGTVNVSGLVLGQFLGVPLWATKAPVLGLGYIQSYIIVVYNSEIYTYSLMYT